MNRIILGLLLLIGTSVSAAPPPGHPTLDQAQQALGLTDPQPLRYRGQVVAAIPSNSYVYLQVRDEQGGERWLAVPRVEVPINSWIRFGEGQRMSNFYSRRLKRTFSEVTFVERIERLGI